MNTYKQGRTPVHPESLKIAIAREYLTGNLGYGALAIKYDLPSISTVRHFVRWYKRHYPDQQVMTPQEAATGAGHTIPSKELEKRLKEANLKIAGLEMLIATAQKELGIDILKKPGTKQSYK